jgi:hypothetical protein
LLLNELDVDMLQIADASGNLEDGAFRDFANVLCKLSAEMVEM